MLWLQILHSLILMALGITVFLFAIRHFSSALKKHLNHKLQPLFNRIGSNRFACVGLGAGATALMQSSSAITAIAVSLSGAGVITLFQATAIIMGANIGTTLTSLMVSLSALPIKYIFISLFFVGLALRIGAQSKMRSAADFFIGFGAIFIGLELLSSSFSNSVWLEKFFTYAFSRITFPLFLIALGIVFTVIIQSSTASMAIYIAMLTNGLLTLPAAIFLTFGSEIGTCFTTLLAGHRAGLAARRAAFTHLLFNLLSALIFTAIFWPFGNYIFPLYTNLITSTAWQLSIFQVIYNTAAVLILIWLIKPLNKLVCYCIKEKQKPLIKPYKKSKTKKTV